MKKILTLLALFLITILLTGCKLPLLKKPPAASQNNSPAIAGKEQLDLRKQLQNEQGGYTGSFAKVLNLGESLECKWKKDNNNYGTAFIKESKYYAKNYNITGENYMLVDSDCIYVWVLENNTGARICYQPSEKEDKWWGMKGLPEADIKYDCLTKEVSDELFQAPKKINFISLGRMKREE